jgi:plastocyanin
MRSTHRRLGLACAMLLIGSTVLVAGCKKTTSGGGGVTPDVTINIVPGAFNKGMMAFSPASATAHVGNVVRLHNGDTLTHDIVTVTANGPTWGSIGQGANRDVTVNTQGTFAYHCIVSGHTMSGEVVVQP